MQENTNLPWVEKYRPQNINDVLHPPIVNFIKDLMTNDFFPHMVFYGVAGTGKTSTIFAITNEYFKGEASKYVLELNASDDRGISVVRSQIKEFCQLQIIKKPEIVLFDDCLSAVDTETEEQILNNLLEITKDKTTIIVSHRVSSAKNADKIIIIDEGKIIQEGTHNQLVNQTGYYAELYLKQLSEKELN